MPLKSEIQEAVKIALKSGDQVTLSTLWLLLSALHNEEIRVRRELSADEIQKTIATLCKQRSEAIELFRKGGREELAQKEEAELSVLKRYLPQPLSDDEVTALIRASIAEAGATGLGDLGKVMKLLMPKVAGRGDGKRVNELAKALLGGGSAAA
ncbi:MAG: GatB/YqeY domain-containing protein [Deltaproteobacteria bacterium]|nr:GatB/YqeY domain-containing protein [Deltaproteobacteria bacterium]